LRGQARARVQVSFFLSCGVLVSALLSFQISLSKLF